MPDLWTQIMQRAVELRRDLHTYPELGWHEHRTAEVIRQELTRLEIPWRTCATFGTLATLEGGQPGEHIALRADMDALALDEPAGKAYCSVNDGVMHACGHDGHTATLLATAAWLKHHQSNICGTVTFLFQPAEEGGHGAAKMIEDGALTGIDKIYGWHNWPAIPFGEIACPDGIVMSGNGTFDVTVSGTGGHASQPEILRDPILAACTMRVALQQIISQNLAPQSAAVVAVTWFDASSNPTTVPDVAKFGGSIRVPNNDTRTRLNQRIEAICQGIAQASEVSCTVNVQGRYDATINHPACAAAARKTWQSLFGDAEQRTVAMPLMASEDFSYYLQHIPGAFALIGADDGNEHHHPCHNTQYDFNDKLIALVTRYFCALVGVMTPDTISENLRESP
uniref:N(2)-acetyl-L-2,4-diaminobutanoate deacetylase DoeB2 n=1 Tax=Thaumasiovibrio occultus TaxID=1891184 RepID=UPI000B356E42|nr:N(2)-acetyl-L-2,4-diaminobutanoate deacetylase DoeB2 [Thaumasiovibrio occultus]